MGAKHAKGVSCLREFACEDAIQMHDHELARETASYEAERCRWLDRGAQPAGRLDVQLRSTPVVSQRSYSAVSQHHVGRKERGIIQHASHDRLGVT